MIRNADVFFSRSDLRAKEVARARHEIFDRRLKQFNCLQQKFRHPHHLHGYVFSAITVITQLSFDDGTHHFQVTY
jgi:hypothetical protein